MKRIKIGFLIDFEFDMEQISLIQEAVSIRIGELRFMYGVEVECEFRFCIKRDSLMDCDIAIDYSLDDYKMEHIINHVNASYMDKL